MLPANLQLKNIDKTEIENTFTWLANSELRKNFLMQDKPSWDKHIAYFEKVKNDPTQKAYAIYLNEKHIGNCGFKYMHDYIGELWIYIGDLNYRGKGLSKPACELLISKGQQDLGLEKIYLHVAKTNFIAISLYESLGFQQTHFTDEDISIWKDRLNSILKYELNLKKKVAMMQPTFLPWQGFFELILKSDKFIFLDDFQLSIQSHQTRNKLFVGKNQVNYYIVPIQKAKSFEQSLNKTLIVENVQWKNKMLRTLEYNYSKTPYFEIFFDNIKKIIISDIKILSELNMEIIKEICKILEIKTHFLLSSDFSKEMNTKSQRTKRVEELLCWANANEYLSAYGAFDYMKDDGYDYNKYPVVFQNYIPKPYRQNHSQEFVPYLSILDALFNIGAEKTLEIIRNGTEHWLSWNDRDAVLKI